MGEQAFSEDEREEGIRSVQDRIGDLLDSWRRVLDDYHGDGVEMQYQRYSQVPRQPLAARRRAGGQPLPARPACASAVGGCMKQKAHGQVRRSQVITTYGPGALIDLPQESAIVAGLDEWPPPHKLDEIDEPRLARKLQAITGVATVQLLAPPPVSSDPSAAPIGIGAWRFPEWFVVQAADAGEGAAHTRSRRLVHRKALDDKRRFEGRDVVATRFVRGCPRGHVDDLDWRRFVHGRGNECPPTRPLQAAGRDSSPDAAGIAKQLKPTALPSAR